jgi:hypothetical protein
VLIVNSVKDVKAPNWENPDCAAIAEQYNTELEIGKVIPHSTKNDWVEKSRGKSKRNKRQRTPSVKKDESNNQNKDNDTSSVPVWPMGGSNKPKRKEYVRKYSSDIQPSDEENTQQGNDTNNSEKSSQPRYADVVKSSAEQQNKSPTTQHSTDNQTPPLETTPTQNVSSQESH